MTDSSFDIRLGPAIDEFLLQCKQGSQPDIKVFADQYPALKNHLLELLPSLQLIENVENKPPNRTKKTPTWIGNHKVIREVGRGGMGIVYEAVDQSLKRRVALKVLLTNAFLQPGHLERFKLEAQAVAKLNHPNIIPVFSVGQSEDADGIHFFTMQFVDGASLNDVIHDLRRHREADSTNAVAIAATQPVQSETIARSFAITEFSAKTSGSSDSPIENLKERPVPEIYDSTSFRRAPSSSGQKSFFRNAARVGLKAAHAIDYAHQHGILHRDIKPANIMLDKDSNVWIADFGLAKSADSNLTESNELVGTLRYLSPDRLGGANNELCDVYALGATLYELVTLQPAYLNTDRAALVGEIISCPPIAPRVICETIPRSLEIIILKAMAREPSQRYQSAGLFADDLQRFLDDLPISARPASNSTRAILWAKRNPFPALLLTALLALALSSVIGATVFSWHLYNKNSELGSANEKTMNANLVASERLFEVSLAEAQNCLTEQTAGRTKRARTAFTEALNLGSELWPDSDQNVKRLRDLAVRIGTSFDVLEGQATEIGSLPPSPLSSCAFNSDLSQIAMVDEDNRLVVRSTDDNRPIKQFAGSWGGVTAKFSNNDRFLVVRGASNNESAQRMFVWDFQNQKKTIDVVTHAIGPFDRNFSMSFDCHNIVFVDKQSRLCLADPASGEIKFSAILPKRPQFLALDSLGHSLLVGYMKSIELFVVSGGKIHLETGTRVFHDESRFNSAVWHPAGGLFASGGPSGIVKVWDVENDQQPKTIFKGHSLGITHLAFNPSGNTLLSRSLDMTTRFWDTEQNGLLLLAGPGGSRFSRDGTMVGFESYCSSYRKDQVVAGLCQQLSASSRRDKEVSDITFSSDQRFMVWGSEYSRLSIWDRQTGLTGKLTDQYYQGISIAFDSDSNSEMMAYSSPYLDKFRFSTEIANDTLRIVDQQSSRVLERDGFLHVEQIDDDFALIADNSDLLSVVNMSDPTAAHRSIALPGRANSVATSSNHKTAVAISSADKLLMVIDLPQGKCAMHTAIAIPCTASISPDGKCVAIASDQRLTVRNVTDLEPIASVSLGIQKYATTRYSNSGNLLAVVVHDEIRILETSDYTELVRLGAPRNAIYSNAWVSNLPTGIAFSPDDSMLAVGTRSNIVHVWNIADILDENFLR